MRWFKRSAALLGFIAVWSFVPDVRAQVLLEDDFETGAISPQWSECFGCGSLFAIEQGQGRGGGAAVRIRYDEDEDNASLNLYGLNWNGELYVRYWQRFPTGFDGRNLKQSNLFHSSGGNYEGALMHALWSTGETQMQTTFYVENEPAWTSFEVPVDEWFETAWYVRYNTPGTSNGVYRLWRNGVLVSERTDVTFLTTADPADGLWIGGNYSGAGAAPIAFDRYIDDVCIGITPEDCGGVNPVDAGNPGLDAGSPPAGDPVTDGGKVASPPPIGCGCGSANPPGALWLIVAGLSALAGRSSGGRRATASSTRARGD